MPVIVNRTGVFVEQPAVIFDALKVAQLKPLTLKINGRTTAVPPPLLLLLLKLMMVVLVPVATVEVEAWLRAPVLLLLLLLLLRLLLLLSLLPARPVDDDDDGSAYCSPTKPGGVMYAPLVRLKMKTARKSEPALATTGSWQLSWWGAEYTSSHT